MSDEEFNKLVTRIVKIVFPNRYTDLSKVLWRLSKGCREYSYYIVKDACWRYNIELTDELFDCALGEVNDGIEVEWETEFLPELTGDSYQDYNRNKMLEHSKEIDEYFFRRKQ